MIFDTVQSSVLMVLGFAAFGFEAFALADALRRKPQAFVAAGKKTKNFWAILLAAAAGVGFVVMFTPLSMFGLLAVVIAAVYLTDVRPALQQVTGRGRTGTMGPYGPW